MTETRWTPEAVAEIIGRERDGMTAAEFAEASKLSASRAYRVLRRAVVLNRLRVDGGGSGKTPARYTVVDASVPQTDRDLTGEQADEEDEEEEFGDDERYPTETELRMLREFAGSPAELVAFLHRHWHLADWGVHTYGGDEGGSAHREPDESDTHRWVHLSTAGWSGNEDRLAALRDSGRFMDFWTRYWFSSRVGGHYRFRIPVDQWDTPIESFSLNWPTPVEDLLIDAISLVVERSGDYPHSDDRFNEVFAAAKQSAEVRIWNQTFGSTTGPFGGFGGAAITTFRIVAILVGHYIVWHLNNGVAFVTQVDVAEEGYALDGWRNGRMPNHRDVAGAIPDWCPSKKRGAR